jgi:hypothetical protein
MIEAERFRGEFNLETGVEYKWVWDHGIQNLERAYKVWADLDNKANEIIKYLGGGTGILAATSLVKADAQNAWIFLAFVPALFVAIISIFFAALARQPNPMRFPPSIIDAFRMSSVMKSETAAKAALIGKLQVIYKGVLLAMEIKSARVQQATWWFFAALAALLGGAVYVLVNLGK